MVAPVQQRRRISIARKPRPSRPHWPYATCHPCLICRTRWRWVDQQPSFRQAHIVKQLHLAVIVCSLLVSPRSLAAQRHERPATFDLTGIVREEASGKPVRGVRVALDSAHLVIAYTDSSGRYRFNGVRRGTYTVAVAALGYYIERREISVECPVDIVDDHDRVIRDGGECDPSPVTLNFFLRPLVMR